MTQNWSDTAIRLLESNRESRASVGLGEPTDLSPLQVAALYEPPIAMKMLEDGVEIDLHSACGLGLIDEIQRLANETRFSQHIDLLTPMGFALLKSQPEAVVKLLECGDDPNRPLRRIGFFVWEIDAIDSNLEEQEWRPIHMAATHGYFDDASKSIDALVRFGADVHAFSVLGEQAIHLAATYGWHNVLDSLISHGCDIVARTTGCSPQIHQLASPNDVEDEVELTPLMIAAREGKDETMKYFIEKGADVQLESSKKRTALHVAADAWWTDNPNCLRVVLDAGANVHSVDNDGKTALDYAKERNYHASVAILTSAIGT